MNADLSLPEGTITFLFTDIEGATTLAKNLGPRWTELVNDHLEIVCRAVTEADGRVVRTVGDAVFAAFPRASDALAAAESAQRELHTYPWPPGARLSARMGLHTGEADLSGGDYAGFEVHRAARISGAGHGGQILLSETTRTLLRESAAEGQLLDLGRHRFKDLDHDEAVFQLVVDGLPAEFPPLKSLNNRPHNLQAQPTALIGREEEIEAIRAELMRDGVRLLTMLGPGGTGKTRLSLAAAEKLRAEFEDGVFFVALANVAEPTEVLPAIAVALSFSGGAENVLETLTRRLQDKRMLLVLDNFEQVVEAGPDISRLLAACPGLKALVTSRTPLNVAGEQEYAVAPLELPTRKPPPTPQQLSQFAAVQLFIARACAVKPNFHVDNDNAAAVAEICHRLDGLPLAIELAAARVKMLAPAALLARLDQRLPVLTGGARDAPARQQSLRQAIEWSYQLLTEDEKILFRRLAVFSGGWTLEAAEAVCAEPGGGEVFDLLCALVDHSLVRQGEDARGDTRFNFLVTIGEYAFEKLAEHGEIEALRQPHSEYHLQWLRDHDLEGTIDKFAVSVIEGDNNRAAYEWALCHDPALLLESSGLLNLVWESISLSHTLVMLEQALDSATGVEPYYRAVAHLCCFERTPDPYCERSRYHMNSCLENIALCAEDSFLAQSLKVKAFTLRAGRVGDRRNEEERRRDLAEVLALAIAMDDEEGVGRAHHRIGESLLTSGDYASALAEIEIALPLLINGHAEQTAAVASYLLGNYSKARDFLQKSREILTASGNIRRARILWIEGRVTAAEGNATESEALLWRGLALANIENEDIGWLHAQFLEALGCLAVVDGGPERAGNLWGCAEAIRERTDIPFDGWERTDYDPALARARAAFDSALFEAAWQRGRAMTVPQLQGAWAR